MLVCVNKLGVHVNKHDLDVGTGDDSIMFGHPGNESEEAILQTNWRDDETRNLLP